MRKLFRGLSLRSSILCILVIVLNCCALYQRKPLDPGFIVGYAFIVGLQMMSLILDIGRKQ